jgi:hypothetical protein
MRLQSRSLRQITGRCRDFHAFARTQSSGAELITHMRARMYRDGQIGGRQKRRRSKNHTYNTYVTQSHGKSSRPYSKAVALVTLEFLVEFI